MVRHFQPVGGKYGNKPAPPQQDSRQNGRSNGGGRGSSPSKDKKQNGSRGSNGHRSPYRDRKSKTPPDAGAIKSRREITLVTMNLSGSGVMGLTPKYKINLIEQFLDNFPDVIFLQVCATRLKCK